MSPGARGSSRDADEGRPAGEPPESLHDLAMRKLGRVLGPETAARVFEEVRRDVGLDAITTPDDLRAFAQGLVARGGMEAAVGGLLSVAAVVRGASGS